MKRPRITILELLLVIGIVALCCAVPGHYERVFERDRCLMTGGWYCDRGTELMLMSFHPAPWMDEFREDFRRFGTWQLQKGNRLRLSSIYDAARRHSGSSLPRWMSIKLILINYMQNSKL